MYLKTMLTLLMALALCTAGWAQTKISGTMQCGKPDPVYTIPVGDRPDHVFTISKATCTWSKPAEIAGTQATTSELSSFLEISGGRGRMRGAGVMTAASGDKLFSSSQGSATVKEGALQTAEGTWTYTGGTGKLRGVKGKGTFKAKATPDGGRTVEVEGEYQLPK
ncbi:MAG: hypothetical protein AAB225_21865 [Acidobacteriota bacterium]